MTEREKDAKLARQLIEQHRPDDYNSVPFKRVMRLRCFEAMAAEMTSLEERRENKDDEVL